MIDNRGIEAIPAICIIFQYLQALALKRERMPQVVISDPAYGTEKS